jgi:hypothetical protein
MTTLVNAMANYLGHRSFLPHTYVDLMLKKAMSLGHPNTMLEVLRLHKELLYHPSQEVLALYSEHYLAQPYDQLKVFFITAVKGNHFLQLPQDFQSKFIQKAHENKDPRSVRQAYLDILDYEGAQLTKETIAAVFESLDYTLNVDHGLVEHLGSTGSKLGLLKDAGIKAHQAGYYYKVKGYLTAVDLLKEAASISGKIPNSDVLKTHFFSTIATAEIDAEVKQQLIDAIKNIPAGKWEDRAFYEIEELLSEKKAEEPQA